VSDRSNITDLPLASHLSAEPISMTSVRCFIEAFELDSPTFVDENSRSDGDDFAIVPWSMAMVAAMPAYWKPGDEPLPKDLPTPYSWDCVDLPGNEMMTTRVELEFERPLRVGDWLQSEYRVSKITPKQTRVGVGNFIDFEVRLIDTLGALVATERSSIYRYTPFDLTPHTKIEKKIASAGDDSYQGSSIGEHTFSLTLQRLIMCSAACRDFAPSHTDNEAARNAGAPAAYADMHFSFAMVEKLLLRWGRPGLRIHAIGPLNIQDFILSGMDATTSGAVLDVMDCADSSRSDVTISIAISQPDGRVPLTGQARVCVPRDALYEFTRAKGNEHDR
jgi:acyl dehydratase